MRELSVLVFAVLSAACGDGGGSFSGNAPPREAPTAPPVTAPSTACPGDHPVQLDVVAETADELPYVDLIEACTDFGHTATVLINRSRVVWRIVTDVPGQATQLDTGSSLAVDSFQALARDVYSGALLFPESRVLVDVAPGGVSWYIHGSLSASWIVHDRFAEAITSEMEDSALDALSAVGSAGRPSPGRRAVLTCVTAAVDLAGTDLDALTGPDPFDQLVAGLGAASSASSCGRSLALAADDYATRTGTEAVWTRRVASMADDIDFMQRGASITDDLLELVTIAIRSR